MALNTVHQPRKLDWDGNGKVLLSTYLDEDVSELRSRISCVLMRASSSSLGSDAL